MDAQPQNGNTARRLTLAVTNATKVAGLVLAVHEGLQSNSDAKVLLVAAFMMAGAQGFEQFATRLFGK